MTGTAAFTTKYYYNAILKKTKILPGGKTCDSYERRQGNQFSLNPGGACNALEADFKKEGFILDHVVLRMGGMNGQIVMQTQSEDYDAIEDDMDEGELKDWNNILKQANLPHSPIQRAPWGAHSTTPERKETDRNFDLYKFLTAYTRSYTARPLLRVKEHIK